MLPGLPPQQVRIIHPTRITTTTSTHNICYQDYHRNKYIYILQELPPQQIHIIYATRITTTTSTYNTSYKNYDHNKYI